MRFIPDLDLNVCRFSFGFVLRAVRPEADLFVFVAPLFHRACLDVALVLLVLSQQRSLVVDEGDDDILLRQYFTHLLRQIELLFRLRFAQTQDRHLLAEAADRFGQYPRYRCIGIAEQIDKALACSLWLHGSSPFFQDHRQMELYLYFRGIDFDALGPV